jgi:hypothetical protein
MTDDPALGYAGSQLQFASLQYALMRERIANTRLDLDTARAAFRHRYAVITPAEIPKGPIKPNALLVMLAAAFAGVFLGIFGAVITDLRSGVLLDRWQLDRLFARSGRRPPVVEAQVP